MNEDRFGSGIELMFGVGFCLLPIFVFGAGVTHWIFDLGIAMSEPTSTAAFDVANGVLNYESISNIPGHGMSAMTLRGVGVWACECGKAGHSKYGQNGAVFRMIEHSERVRKELNDDKGSIL